MRLLYVVQRYGAEVAGGAEAACRSFAEQMRDRGHAVEVLTSRAREHVDWADTYGKGSSKVNGVTVHRLSGVAPRDHHAFGQLNERVLRGARPVPLTLQREWMRRQGPFLPELQPWLRRQAASYDAVVFFTYLWYPTYAGLPVAAALAPTVFHPTAHDEQQLGLPLFDEVFAAAHAYSFFTPEEAALMERRYPLRAETAIVGIGQDLDVDGDPDRFRRRTGLGDRPYLVTVGRVESGKGSVELYDYFVAYKRRNPGPLALVVVGAAVTPLDPHSDIVLTGFVDEQTKRDAVAGAAVLVNPSFWESFSMVLTEAWSLRRPVLVQGRCDVLAGQARRSGGGIPYAGFGEFEAAVDLLMEDSSLRDRLAEHGRAFVEREYRWETVLDRYEDLIERARAAFARDDAQLRTVPR